MTQKEAVIEALNILHGEGELKWITLIALKLDDVDWSKTKTPEASIRRIVRENPNEIVALGNARYELVEHKKSVEKHIAEETERNAELDNLKSSPYRLDSLLDNLHSEPPCYDDQKSILDFLEKITQSEDDKKKIRDYKNWLYHADKSKGFRFESGSQNNIYTN